jgi:hypothetical protein
MFGCECFGAQHITRTLLRKHFSQCGYAQMPCFLGSRAHVTNGDRLSPDCVARKIRVATVRIFATRAFDERVRRAHRVCDATSQLSLKWL